MVDLSSGVASDHWFNQIMNHKHRLWKSTTLVCLCACPRGSPRMCVIATWCEEVSYCSLNPRPWTLELGTRSGIVGFGVLGFGSCDLGVGLFLVLWFGCKGFLVLWFGCMGFGSCDLGLWVLGFCDLGLGHCCCIFATAYVMCCASFLPSFH